MKSFPWNSIVDGIDPDSGFPVYDRTYDAEDFRNVLQRFFSDGIFADEPLGFGVTAGEGMTVQVEGGSCLIQGTTGIETETRTLMIQAADRDNPRIDTVVLRWDSDIEERSIDLYVLEGTPSEEPVRPELTRLKGTVWELGLCDILIPAESTSILNVHMTDTRLDPARCGIVTPYSKFDSTSLYNVLKAKVDEMVELVKSAMDGTTAGHLQNQIDELSETATKDIEEVNTKINKINDFTTGINLLKGTRGFTKSMSYISEGFPLLGYKVDGDYIYEGWDKDVDDQGYTYLSANMKNYYSLFQTPSFTITNQNVYTISFDVKIDDFPLKPYKGGTLTSFSWLNIVEVYCDEIKIASLNLSNAAISYDEITGWSRVAVRFTASRTGNADISITFKPTTQDLTIRIKKLKVEEGFINKPVWSLNPFEIALNTERPMMTRLLEIPATFSTVGGRKLIDNPELYDWILVSGYSVVNSANNTFTDIINMSGYKVSSVTRSCNLSCLGELSFAPKTGNFSYTNSDFPTTITDIIGINLL